MWAGQPWSSPALLLNYLPTVNMTRSKTFLLIARGLKKKKSSCTEPEQDLDTRAGRVVTVICDGHTQEPGLVRQIRLKYIFRC